MATLEVVEYLIQVFSKQQSEINTEDKSKQMDELRSRITPEILKQCIDIQKYSNKQQFPYIRILPTTPPSKAFIEADNECVKKKRIFIETYKSNPSSLFSTMNDLTNLVRPMLMSIPMADPRTCKCTEYKQILNTKCYWIQHDNASLSNGVILAFPGSGYCYDIVNHAFAQCELLSRLTGCVCIVVQYKKAPKYPISKKQISDGLNVYQHFLTVKKVPPQKITFMGDSSGGGLVLLILQRLGKTYPDSLPKCALLTSPWCHLQYDVADHVDGEEYQQRPNLKYDARMSYCALNLLAKCALGQMDEKLNEIVDAREKDVRTYNPVFGDFKVLHNVAMYFSVGATEALLCDTLDAADKAYQAGCKTLKCDIYPYVFHSWHVFVDRYKEAQDIVHRWAQFILDHVREGKVGLMETTSISVNDFPKCKHEPDSGHVVSV
eukprot:54441_1